MVRSVTSFLSLLAGSMYQKQLLYEMNNLPIVGSAFHFATNKKYERTHNRPTCNVRECEKESSFQKFNGTITLRVINDWSRLEHS